MNNQKTSKQLLAEWIAASDSTEYLSAENSNVEMATLSKLRLTEYSVMGCLLKDLGYILCKNQFIRILGGKNSVCKSFFEINALYTGTSLLKDVLIIADTANGGLFGLNCNQQNGATLGEVLYLPYSSFTWERLDIGYSDFVRWVINVSETELISGGWIEKPQREIQMSVRDTITYSKIDVLLSIKK